MVNGKMIEIDYYDKGDYYLAFASTHEEDGLQDHTGMGKSRIRRKAIKQALSDLENEWKTSK